MTDAASAYFETDQEVPVKTLAQFGPLTRVDRGAVALRQPILKLRTWCGELTDSGSSSSYRVAN
jgi:hypothetical protein